jgi:hypothetical protein
MAKYSCAKLAPSKPSINTGGAGKAARAYFGVVAEKVPLMFRITLMPPTVQGGTQIVPVRVPVVSRPRLPEKLPFMR